MKTLTLSFIILLITVSCSTDDKLNQIAKLELQRDELTVRIDELRQEVAEENGILVNENLSYVNIEPLAPKTFKHFIKVQGTVNSDNNIFIPPQSSGIVKAIHVNEGDRVRRGQLLAELDGSILESTMEELEIGLQLANTVFERQERLWEKNIGSEIQYLQAKSNKESLEKRLSTTKKQYNMSKITAPINGTIDKLELRVGEMAVAGIGAIRIVQLSDLKIDASLSESYISQINKNDSVLVQFPVLDEQLLLQVKSVSKVIDPNNRTFNIELKVPKTKLDIRPNMTAILSINNYTNNSALTIPINIIQRTANNQFVYIARDNTELDDNHYVVEKRFVKTGLQYDNIIEITEGLESGDILVTFGYQDLADGQIVATNKKPKSEYVE